YYRVAGLGLRRARAAWDGRTGEIFNIGAAAETQRRGLHRSMSIDRDGSGLRKAFRQKLRARLRGKAKPIGSLGRLEDLAEQIGMITNSLEPDLGKAEIIIFAGDHGLTEEGVTAY